MAEPLLELTTLIEQPTIRIDGDQYEIRHPEQLSIIDAHHLQTMALRIEKIMGKPKLDDAGAADVSAMIIDLSDRIMFGVPAEKRARLTETQRLSVVGVFMKIPRAQSRKTRKKKSQKASRSAGSKRQSDANGSTAATPPAG